MEAERWKQEMVYMTSWSEGSERSLAALWKQWLESHKERRYMPLWTVSLLAVCRIHGRQRMWASRDRKADSAVCKGTSQIWFPPSRQEPHPFSRPLSTVSSGDILSTCSPQHTQLPSDPSPLLCNASYSTMLIHMAASFLFSQSPLLYDLHKNIP